MASYSIQVNRNYVELPDGKMYYTGSVVLLTQTQYNLLIPRDFTSGVLTLLATIPDASSGTLTPTTTKTSDYTSLASELVRADATSAGVTVTAPTTPVIGQVFGVVKIDSTANTVTVVATGKTINGLASATYSTQWAGATFVYDGSNWLISSINSSSGSTVTSVVALTGAITGSQILADATVAASLSSKASLASPALTGNPTAPTPTTGDNDTSVSTTAFVQTTANSAAAGLSIVFGV